MMTEKRIELQPSSFTFRWKVGYEAKVYFHEVEQIRPQVEAIVQEWDFIRPLMDAFNDQNNK